MGVYLNPGARMLQISRNSKIYVLNSQSKCNTLE